VLAVRIDTVFRWTIQMDSPPAQWGETKGGRRVCPKRILEPAQRSLVVLSLISAISILGISHPVPTASQEREAHLQRAIGELLDGKPLPALAEASQAVEASPRSAEALAVLGLAQLKCGEWEKAESRFNEAIAIDGASPDAHLGLGIIATSKTRYHDAIPHLRQATSSQFFKGTVHRALALTLEELNLHQEASQEMREAGKYKEGTTAEELANARAFADIFAAHDGRSLCRVPRDFSSTSVHFKYSQGHILLPVSVNESPPVDFIHDTGHGGSLMISGDNARGLNLTYVGEITTTSLYGDLRLKAAVVDSIRIGGLVMSDVPVLVCENSPFGSIRVIGWKIIQRLNTSIDFEARQIQLSSLDNPALDYKTIAAKENTECVPFVYLTSMYLIARFGDDVARAFVFDTGAVGSYLHSTDYGPEGKDENSPCSIRIGDLTFDLPQTQYIDFSAIHERGHYYFPGVIGPNILTRSVVHILPRDAVLCIETQKS